MNLSRAKRLASRWLLVAATATATVAIILVTGRTGAGGAPAFETECAAGNPYYVTTCFRAQSRGVSSPERDAPSVLLFRDTPLNAPSHSLATYEQTGPVWGLAYRASEPALYASSYLKRGLPHGPGGPGAVYRIDLATGAVTDFLKVPDVGADAHGRMMPGLEANDVDASPFVGERSLGDLELSTDQSLLFVTNLADRKIYRFEMPSGALVGSFDNGAAAEPWSEDARPFGLAVHDGWLFHGLVDSGVTVRQARIYRTRYDGSEMKEVARLDLTYKRQRMRLNGDMMSADWHRWDDPRNNRYAPIGTSLESMPMLTDVEFTSDGDMVVALHDRRWDVQVARIDVDRGVSTPPAGGLNPSARDRDLGFGDILLARRDGDAFQFEPASVGTEHFDDANAMLHDESALGGLARAPGLDQIVGGVFGVERNRSVLGWEGLYWWRQSSGERASRERTCRPRDADPYTDLISGGGIARVSAHNGEETAGDKDFGTVGDVEALCRTDIPTATPTATSTATSTPTPTDTPTATPSPTPTRIPEPLYLPIGLREFCDPALSRSDIVLVLDASTSMEGEKFEAALAAAAAFVRAVRLPSDQVGIVAFNRASTVVSPLSGDLAALEGAIQGIRMSPGTRIDTGLEAARTVLAGPERRLDAVPVVVVMTDGIQEAEQERPLVLADALREDGVALFVIGLGADVDIPYLEQLAAGRDALYLSPSAEELVGIYEQLARLIPCPAKDYWGGR